MRLYLLPAIIVLAFIALDIICGIVKGAKAKSLNSTVMREGLYHKIGFILAVVLAAGIEYAMKVFDLGFALPLFVPVCVFIVLTEIVSILENLKEINPELASDTFMRLFGKHSEDA